MLILDRREPDDLVSAVRHLGVEVSVSELEFGDCAFAGNGENGDCMVGVERKKLDDLINCMRDRRLSGHQLRGLWQAYDYVWLCIEGVWRPGPAGEIEQLRGREWRAYFSSRDRHAVSFRQLAAFQDSLTLRSRSATGEPLRIIRTQGVRETALRYAALYSGFVEKKWSDHHAHDQIYCPEPTMPKRGGRAGLVQEKVTVAWKIAAQLPGLDGKRGLCAAKYFKTPRAMANANETDWQAVEGIGPKLAAGAVKAMTEEGV